MDTNTTTVNSNVFCISLAETCTVVTIADILPSLWGRKQASFETTDTSPFYTAVYMRGSCTNSLHPPLCESFRCGEGGNITLAPLEVV